MILLRYGIRCTLHYSVPLTLGLLAYSGNWQGAASRLLTEADPGASPSKSNPPPTSGTVDIASSAPAQTTGDSGGPEARSIAMNPVDASSVTAGTTIPRAGSRERTDNLDSPGSSSQLSRSGNSDQPPRDRNIDATGHESPAIAADSRKAELAGATGAASIAAAGVLAQNLERSNSLFSASPDKAEPKSIPSEVTNPAETDNGSIEVAATKASGSQPDPKPVEKPKDAVTVVTSETHPSSNADLDNRPANGIEPADLNPQIRAIAAEVPNSTKPISEPASQPSRTEIVAVPALNAEPEKSPPKVEKVEVAITEQQKPPEKAIKPQESTPASEPLVIAKADTQQAEPAPVSVAAVPKSASVERPEPPDNDPKQDKRGKGSNQVSGFIIAGKGETWNRIAERIYGDSAMADAIRRENLDAHDGSADAMPIAGRMIRIPEPAKRPILTQKATQLARTAR